MSTEKHNANGVTKAAKGGATAARNPSRSAAKASPRSAKPPRKSLSGPGSAPLKPAGAARNKAAFVRDQPLGTPAKTVVAAAARLGMTMTPDYVHKVRSTAKARSLAPAPGIADRRTSGRKIALRTDYNRLARPSFGVVRAGTAEAAFRKLVLELGLQRAKDLLAEVERKLGALIRG